MCRNNFHCLLEHKPTWLFASRSPSKNTSWLALDLFLHLAVFSFASHVNVVSSLTLFFFYSCFFFPQSPFVLLLSSLEFICFSQSNSIISLKLKISLVGSLDHHIIIGISLLLHDCCGHSKSCTSSSTYEHCKSLCKCFFLFLPSSASVLLAHNSFLSSVI